MTRVMLRAGKSPLQPMPLDEVFHKDAIYHNSGNILFAHSVLKAISTPGTIVEVNAGKLPTAEVANERYDMLVIPLANAFRKGFDGKLLEWAALIKQIKIPVVVVGVGAQARFDGSFNNPPLNDAVKKFVGAVLDRSASIGVRGEYTREYLNKLGFSAVDTIGCPSMFLNGSKMNVQKKVRQLDRESKVTFNITTKMPANISEFYISVLRQYPTIEYVAQDLNDLGLLLWGTPVEVGPTEAFPSVSNHPVYAEGRTKFFSDVKPWTDYMGSRDFSFGTRIHGNVFALLGGTPGLVVAHDSRTLELAQYFDIPYVDGPTVDGGTRLADLYDRADYTKLNRGHEARFSIFKKFLDKNGIDHIYNHEASVAESFDEKIAALAYPPPVKAITALDRRESQERIAALLGYHKAEMAKVNAKVENLRAQVAALKAKQSV